MKQFLEQTLPVSSTYVLATLSNNTIKHSYFNDIQSLRTAAQSAITLKHDVYFAVASYKNNRRTGDNVAFKRSWYVDIDCGDGKNYPTKRDAIVGISEALKNGMPNPTFIVSSGNGWYLYWCVDTDVTPTSWKQYSQAISGMCVELNLNIDSAVTNDVTRILRLPESLNYKDPSNPVRCEIKRTGTVYNYNNFISAINKYLPGPASVVSSPLPPLENPDMSTDVQPTRPARASEMVKQCEIFKHSVATGGADDDYPLWFSLIATLSVCEDGADWIHKISEKHPSYSEGNTDKQWATVMSRPPEKRAGVTCKRFEMDSDKCKKCEFHGEIKSPIKLAYGKFEKQPEGYVISADKTCTFKVVDGEFQLAFRHVVTNLSITYDRGNVAIINFVMDKEHVTMELNSLNRTDVLQGELSKYALSLQDADIGDYKVFMRTWLSEIRAEDKITEMITSFGWTEDYGFHHANTIYQPDGTKDEVYKVDKQMKEVYKCEGDLAVWQECANYVLSQNRKGAWCVVASAFAAPLMTFTGATGALFSLVSQNSGTGKSTAMKIAQAVWGNPKKAMSSLNDTGNAVSHRLGQLKNLPLYWDEVRQHEEVAKFIQTVFRLAQGRDKARMTSQITARETGEWETMMICATNESIKEHMAHIINNSDAGDARVFEVFAEDIHDTKMNDAEARHFYDRLKDNYGTAGAVYAEYLAKNNGTIKELVKKMDSKYSSELNSSNEERFWTATAATLTVGAAIATKLGICKFDVPALSKYLKDEIMRMRGDKKESWDRSGGQDYFIDRISEFLEAMKPNMVISETVPTGAGGVQNHIILSQPRDKAVYVRVGRQDGVIRFTRKALMDWFTNSCGPVGIKKIVDELKKRDAMLTRVTIDAGTSLSTGTRHWCFTIDTNSPDFADFEWEAPEVGEQLNSDLGGV